MIYNGAKPFMIVPNMKIKMIIIMLKTIGLSKNKLMRLKMYS